MAGWSWGIEDAIRSTPLDALSRSRVADRWTVGGVGRGSVTLVGEDMGWGQAATGGGECQYQPGCPCIGGSSCCWLLLCFADTAIACHRPLEPPSHLGLCVMLCVGDAAHPTTPNLGQGGCLALEDAVVLARALGGVLSSDSITTQAQREAVERALRGYEAERSRRCLQLTVRVGSLDGTRQGQGVGGSGGPGSTFMQFTFLQPRSHQERCGTKIY